MKQAIVMRTDLKMGKGKIAAQACHASICCYKKASRVDVQRWELDFNLFTIQGTLVYGAKVENAYHVNIRTNF